MILKDNPTVKEIFVDYIETHFKRIKGKIIRFYQRITRGWDDSDTWSLDHTIAKYILPRLKRFREIGRNSCPVLHESFEFDRDFEEWNEILDKMILAFELIVDDEKSYFDNLNAGSDEEMGNYIEYSEDRNLKINTGMDLFCKYFNHLWW